MNTGGTFTRPLTAALAIALTVALNGCSGGDAQTPTPTPAVAQTYGTVTDLRDALVAAGFDCPAWEQNDRISRAAQSGDCDDDSVLSTYTSEGDRDEIVANLKAFGDASMLVGPNWILNSPDAADWQPKIGGAVVTN